MVPKNKHPKLSLYDRMSEYILDQEFSQQFLEG